MSYANGQAPESDLVLVDGVHTVPSLVSRTKALIAFANTQGFAIHIAPPYGSYRTLDEQAQLHGTGNSGSSIPVASPGYSTHGVYDVGRVDFVGADGYSYTTAELTWLVANASSFGLTREFGSRDPNHFMASGGFAGDAGTPISNTSSLRDKMRLLPQDETKTYFLEVEGVGLYVIPDQDVANSIYRYLFPGPNLQRADIEAVAKFVSGPPTFRAFYGGPTGLPVVSAPAPVIDYKLLAQEIAAQLPAAPKSFTITSTGKAEATS